MDNSVTTFYRNIHWIGIKDTDKIMPKWIKWGEKQIQPGYILDKIGSKKRSSLDIGKPLKYRGIYIHMGIKHVLFEVVSEASQVELFEDEIYDWFIGLLYVDQNCFLAPSSSNGFYDIRP